MLAYPCPEKIFYPLLLTTQIAQDLADSLWLYFGFCRQVARFYPVWIKVKRFAGRYLTIAPPRRADCYTLYPRILRNCFYPSIFNFLHCHWYSDFLSSIRRIRETKITCGTLSGRNLRDRSHYIVGGDFLLQITEEITHEVSNIISLSCMTDMAIVAIPSGV